MQFRVAAEVPGDFHRRGEGLGWRTVPQRSVTPPMLDISPDIAPPVVRLSDYQPPAFLIDTVDLVFELDSAETRVKSRLGIRRNPAASEADAPLRLDGEELDLVSLALDGEALGANRYQRPPQGGLLLSDVPDVFTLDVETRISPENNKI